ncbi:TonB-dependent receptor domain-containing protein [Algibacillus agarilyticus]|uniref:TonB-dependent receptor domain-containing protein n=1 Tax=Algibacillus agarilyticus TaxID=2234133 RepID=UPI000DD0786E|nr:TonB-dependent receptor [Algibacillus agarilyticus]
MTQQFKLKAISVAIAASFITMPIYAAEEVDEEAADESIEVIEITGFRGSLQKAMNAKRFAKGISDSIHAEDVGKSTDQNIADALSRVTGVTVQESDGEGTRISVRGAGPSLNQISMNGVALTGGLSGDGDDAVADNSVDLSSFSADILSSIDVIKTASADQDEGSLGANVILRTVKPLNLNAPRRNVTVEARNNEYSGETDGRVSLSLADKFFDETFGVVFTVSKDEQKTRQDRMTSDWYESSIPIADALSNSGRKAHDIATGKPIRILQEGQTAETLPEVGTAGYNVDDYVYHEGNLNVLARDFQDFGANFNIRSRETVNLGLQFRPGDDTDIQLDISHTKQEVETDNHRIRLNFAPAILPFSGDPLVEWNGVDLENNTLASTRGRHMSGWFNRSTGLQTVETDVVSLAIEHQLTDTLKVSLTSGFSNTNDETDGHIAITSATWGTTGQTFIEGMDSSVIEPIGYDCSDPANCSFFTGETVAQADPLDGSLITASSRFNPFDLDANHLGGFSFRDNYQEDTNKSLFVDFDWDLDVGGITTVEFGFKVSNRKKDVDALLTRITNGQALVDSENSDLNYATNGMQSIKLADIMSDEAFPVNNFAEGLQDDRSNDFFAGWPMLSTSKAIAEYTNTDSDSVRAARNTLGSREIETDTQALYGKVNFEFMDGRLTGDVGFRYIKDETVASGVSGINFYTNAHATNPYELVFDRGLANVEAGACSEEPEFNEFFPNGVGDQRYGTANEAELQNCHEWRVTHAYVYNNRNTWPVDPATGEWRFKDAAGNPDYDVNRLLWVDYSGDTPVVTRNDVLPSTIIDINGNTVSTKPGQHRSFNSGLRGYVDTTTILQALPGEDDDRAFSRESALTDMGSNSMFLPSLNLNYQFNADMIGRFAISKTMSRPTFDSLNPRLELREDGWQPTAKGTVGNTQLKPLESNNLDLSWEWYFNESSMTSAAIFYKDMSNFEEEVQTPYYYKDVREQYDLASGDLLLEKVDGMTPSNSDCQAHRYMGGQNSDWAFECHEATVDVIKNGKGATIKGVELAYNQTYDFLPGALSGLGLSINYTYADSESDAEEIGNSGLFLKPLPQPFTPKHSANTTIFWEKNGIQLRLANRFNDVQLVDRGLVGGAIWQDASNRLDFSSSYRINKMFTVTFQATNLTDDKRRTFYTSTTTVLGDGQTLDEGNPMNDSGVYDERTWAEYKTGRQYRLGLRATF